MEQENKKHNELHEHVHDETCNHSPQEHEEMSQGMNQQDQEKYMRLSILDQQARQIQQQLEILDQQIIELQLLKLNLDDINKAESKQEMLTSIGKNIFLKTELKSKELYVDIGARTVVKKNIDETKTIIDKDIKSLAETREKIMQEFSQIAEQIQRE